MLKDLTYEYWSRTERPSPIKDIDNILCSGFAEFFDEYETEFGIKIELHRDGQRTLKKALQFPQPPPGIFTNGCPDSMRTNRESVSAILFTVWNFLIAKASEEVAEGPATSEASPQQEHTPPDSIGFPTPEGTQTPEAVEPPITEEGAVKVPPREDATALDAMSETEAMLQQVSARF